MKKNIIRACPVCSGSVGDVLHHQQFADYDKSPLPTEYDVVACVSCGFVYADTAATQSEYDLYYREFSKYEDENISSGVGQDWELERFATTANDIESLVADRKAEVLDLGCAHGGLLDELSQRGYLNLSGMDHAASCVANINRKGFKGYLGGITDIPRKTKMNFDVVIMSHVLEHLYDLKSAISNCRLLLKDGGILYVETPDATKYPEYTIVPYYFFDCEHINHFSIFSLRSLIQPYGFDFIKSASKSFFASSTTKYPAVWALFQKTDKAEIISDALVDSCTKKSIEEHIAISKTMLANPILDSFVDSRTPIIVWGAGSFAQRMIYNSSLGKCNIEHFVDNDTHKWGKTISGYEICRPQRIKDESIPIVVCAALFSEDICDQIKSMGIKNDIIPLVNNGSTSMGL